MGKTNTGWNLENTYSNLPKMFYSKGKPKPISSPKLVVINDSLGETYAHKGYEEYMVPPEPSPFTYKTYCGT